MKRLANHFSSASSSRSARSPSPAPTYRTVEPSSHDKLPSQTQGLNIRPRHDTTVNKMVDVMRSDRNYKACRRPESRLHFLLSSFVRNWLGGSLRSFVWEDEVPEPSSQEEFDEIVDSTHGLLVREVLDSPKFKARRLTGADLHMAVETRSTRAVAVLLDLGLTVDVSQVTDYGEATALGIAAKDGQAGMVRMLLNRGADANGPEGGMTPLCIAARGGYLRTVKLLLEAGADVQRKFREWTALFEASLHGEAEVVQLLLKYGADVETQTPSGSTALQEAGRMGHGEVARLLIEAGADVSPPWVLYNLAGHGLEDVSILVVERGADVNGWAPRMSGTALHEAARTGLSKLVRVMLDGGADAHVKNDKGDAPLAIAYQNDHRDVVEQFRSHTTSQKEKNMIEEREMRSDEPEDDPPPPYTA